MNISDLIIKEAHARGIDPELALRVMLAESGGNHNAVSPKGAIGAMQLMPATARDLGVNPNDPAQNARGGVEYLARQLERFRDPRLAVAAYNAGPGNVQKYGDVPPFKETQNYVNKIIGNRQQQPQQPSNDGSAIFGLSGVSQPQAQGGFNGADLFKQESATPAQATPQAVPKQELHREQRSLIDGILNSPIGGAIRGIRDIPDAGAQLLLRSLESIAPAGSYFEKYIKSERQNVEAINRNAQKDYLENWRQGKLEGVDVGRIAGNIIGTLPAAAVAAPTSIGGAAGYGSIVGALSNPVDTTKNGENTDFLGEKLGQAASGAIGGAAGAAIGKGLSRLIKPIPRLPDSGRLIGIDAANRLGVNLTPGQNTGSLGLRQVESVLERTPGSAGPMNVIKDANQQAVNSAVARSIGESGNSLNEAVIASAKDRLGKEFERLSASTNLNLGSTFTNAVKTLEASNNSLGSFKNSQISDLVEKGFELAAKGTLDGRAYQTLRSRLTDRASDAFKSGNSEYGRAIKSIVSALDDTARSGLTPATQKAWDAVRAQYANLKTITKGNVISAGNVSPSLLANSLRTNNPDAFKAGAVKSPLMDVARYAEFIKPSMVPNSGTAERSVISNMLFGNPITGLPLTLGSRGLQMLMFSRPGQYYLNNGILPLSPMVEKALTAGGGMVGAGSANQK